MITDKDIYWFINDDKPGKKHMSLGFGVDGTIVIDIPMYVDFYDLLKSTDSIEAVESDYSIINFIKNGEVVETLKTSPFLGSLIASGPDLLDIYTHPNPIQYWNNQGVGAGWKYDADHNFSMPYEGWDTEMIDGLYNGDRVYSPYEFYTGDQE